MVASRLSAVLLESAPVVLVAGLAAWAFWDFLGIPGDLETRVFVVLLLAGLASLVLGLRFGYATARRAGLALVAVSYIGAHVVALPLDPAAALAFLTLVLVVLELRILAERFAPILAADLDPDLRGRVDAALAHSVIRIAAASAVAFLGSTLTADLALSGTLPLHSIATALLLAFALIVVVLLLASWPLIERRLARTEELEAPIQTPK